MKLTSKCCTTSRSACPNGARPGPESRAVIQVGLSSARASLRAGAVRPMPSNAEPSQKAMRRCRLVKVNGDAGTMG